MNVGSLFSGIGGLDEGLRRAGWDHVFLCESDAYRRDVLRARFPGIPIYEDVRSLGRHGIQRVGSYRSSHWAKCKRELLDGAVDLLCGGFPCQDLSVAGRRAGIRGERSGLFFEFARIAESLRPRLLLIENVPGLFSSNGGRDFGELLGTLADIGYGLGWRVLDSRFFGVPQRRRRVFIVGALAVDDPRAAAERAGEVLAVGEGCSRHSKTRGEAGQDVAKTLARSAGNSGYRGEDHEDYIVSHALTNEGHDASEDGTGRGTPLVATPLSHGSNPNSNMAGRRREDDENLVAVHMLQDPISDEHITPAWGKGTKTGSASIAIANGAGVRRLTPVECERLQALPDGWTDLGGTPDSRRYAALGDAVTASVAEWIGRRLLAHVQAKAAA